MPKKNEKKINFMKTKLLLIICMIYYVNSNSQTLDNSFGMNGKVTTSFGSTVSVLTEVAIQPDNKILACGTTLVGTNYQIALCRFNTDGSLDTSFGTNGKVISNVGGTDFSGFQHIAIQTDNKIIVSGINNIGSANYDFAMIRYNSDGTLDNTFGTNGVVITDFNNGRDECYSIALQNDGKIILAGQTYLAGEYYNFGIARYNSNGSLDSTFGTNGKVSIDFGFNSVNSHSNDGAYSIKIQSNGKLILGGWSDYSGIIEVNKFAIMRLNTNGILDATFGTNGKVITDFGNDNVILALAIGSDDKIIAGGQIGFGTNQNTKIGIAKYDSNGILETTFGTNGKVQTQINTSMMKDNIWALTLQNDNKIVAGGYSLNSSNYDFSILRYNTDGTLDTSFNLNGIINTDFNNSQDRAYAITIQNDDKIVAGGFTNSGTSYNFALARYNNTILNNQTFINEKPFIIYPNPANDKINIISNKFCEIEKIIIFDALGNIVLEQKKIISEINIQNLNDGLYLIQITSENKKFDYKFIKK